MVTPIERTFHFLKNSANRSAISIMSLALESSQEQIHDMAVEALSTSENPIAHLELINNYEKFSEKCKQTIHVNALHMNRALEDVIQRDQGNSRTSALNIIEQGENYGMIKGLLKVLAFSKEETESNQILNTIRELTDSLYERNLNYNNTVNYGTPNYKNILIEFISTIEHSVHDVRLKPFQASLIEFVLILGEPGDLAVDSLMKNHDKEIIEKAEQILLTGQHVGLMSLASKYMSWKLPHKYALIAFEKRTDPEFVFTILRELPLEMTDLDLKNYNQLSNVSWLSKKESLIRMMSPSLQVAMVRFVSVLGIPDELKKSMFQWVISNGCSEACEEASGIMDVLKTDEVIDLLSNGLESENVEVQAWAVTHLRDQHVPNAIQLIVDRLDSSVDVVREAARKELQSFNVDYVIQIYDKLKPEVAKNVGALIKKTDPDYKEKFISYLHSPIISNRLKAIQTLKGLNLYLEFVPELMSLAEDPDQQVKRTLINVLSLIPQSNVIETLKFMSEDENEKVKQASLIAIDKLMNMDDLKVRLQN